MFEFCSDDLKQTLIPARIRMKELEDRKLEAKRQLLMRPESSTMTNQNESQITTTPSNNGIHNGNIMAPTGWYNLLAVLTHIGRSADSGHYMAWVQSSHDKEVWWKFDDDHVTAVHSDDISKLDGGGDWHIAYLCLYREYMVPMSD
jgi:ubiquitin carboxyl-terminal hydrolase 14